MTKPITIPDPKILCGALEEISGGTLLHQACSLGSSSVLAVFLNNFDGTMPRNSNLQTPLHLAVAEGSMDCIHIVIAYLKGKIFSVKQIKSVFHFLFDFFDALQFHFAFNLNIHFMMLSVTDLVEEVNAKDSSLNAPLHLAIEVCQNGIEILETLADFGADLDVVNGSGDTPLRMAMSRGSHEATEFLISRGANQIREWSVSPQH